MALSEELAYTTVAELAARIRRRELSPVEVLDATIERIEARNPSVNALVHLGFDDARAAARSAEDAVMSGAELGPLHGVPAAIKDLFDFKPGWPATFGGIPALRDFKLDTYCAFAERVERAGAILVGKGNSPVMGFRGTCDNPLFGPSRNPFDTNRNTGGSSGGCAAAVADGLSPLSRCAARVRAVKARCRRWARRARRTAPTCSSPSRGPRSGWPGRRARAAAWVRGAGRARARRARPRRPPRRPPRCRP